MRSFRRGRLRVWLNRLICRIHGHDPIDIQRVLRQRDHYRKESDGLAFLLQDLNKRVIPGQVDSIDSLRNMYAEWKALQDENRALWEKIDFAIPSMKRDLNRSSTFGALSHTNRFKIWFKDLDDLRDRSYCLRRNRILTGPKK